MLFSISPIVPVASQLDEIPDECEILKCLRGMRESAPGLDLITVAMIRHGGEVLRGKVMQIIKDMWVQEPETWESLCHHAEVIALFKKTRSPLVR